MFEYNKLIVSSEKMERILLKSYAKSTSIPKSYPTVESIDMMVYGFDWRDDPQKYIFKNSWEPSRFFLLEEEKVRTFGYFIINIIYGFRRDDVWFIEHPECNKNNPTVGDLYKYLTVPFTSGDLIQPHVGIWSDNDDIKKKEDIQAAFEYMQGMLIDGDFFEIHPPQHMNKAAA